MRYLAATLLVCAALDLPFPFVDRAGLVAAGLAALALALPPRPASLRRPAFAPPATVELAEPELEDEPELDVASPRRRFASDGWSEA